VVSPDKKCFKLFKEDAFIKEVLQENFYSTRMTGPPQKP
jgi:hypothetical protein